MIEIAPTVHIDESELQFEYIRASGPGGQNVNKVATSVQLRFDVRNSPSLEPEIKERLKLLAANHMTEEGVLIITAKRFRTQEQNRLDAMQRFTHLVQAALKKPKIRKATHPGVSAKAERLFQKKRRAEVKRMRSYHPDDWE